MKIMTPLFGPIGDTLMALALFDDILTLDPQASFCIITRNNADVVRDLACAYPQITVRRIPTGAAALPFFLSLLSQRGTLLTLGVAEHYSLRLKLFFYVYSLLGNRTIGIDETIHKNCWQPLATVLPLDPNISTLAFLRNMLPYLGCTPAALAPLYNRPPHVALIEQPPVSFPYVPGHYIVAHLFGAAPWRTFPAKRWITLLSTIAREHPQLPIILTGAEKDRAAAEQVARKVPHTHCYINLPILEVAHIVDHAALYIGVDTGITHLAGVLQQKSVIISHCGDLRWRPLYNPNARVLANSRHCTCHTGFCDIYEDGKMYRRCLYDITDEAVLSSVRLALMSTSRAVPNFAGWRDEYKN